MISLGSKKLFNRLIPCLFLILPLACLQTSKKNAQIEESTSFSIKEIQEDGTRFPLIEASSLPKRFFYKYLICEEKSTNCFNGYFNDGNKAFKGLNPGEYKIYLFRCQSGKNDCEFIGNHSFSQEKYSDRQKEMVYKISWLNKAILQEKILTFFKELKTFSLELKACKSSDPELKKYIDYIDHRASIPIEKYFDTITIEDFENSFSPVSLINNREERLGLVSVENTVPVRLIIWNYEKPKPIFPMDGKTFFSFEGLKQTLLGRRYGHSALIVGERTPEGAPAGTKSKYVSFPFGDKYCAVPHEICLPSDKLNEFGGTFHARTQKI